jgi:hypothetical protein
MSSAQDPFYIVREEIQDSVIRTSLSLFTTLVFVQ